jgi:hypothetical protein
LRMSDQAAPTVPRTGHLVRMTAVATGLAGSGEGGKQEKTIPENINEHLENMSFKGTKGCCVLVRCILQIL